MFRKSLAFVFIGVALMGSVARGADFISLEWGQFNVDSESLVKPKSVSFVNGQDKLGLSMTLDTLVANADGGKLEGSSSMTGDFVVQQPHQLSLPSMTVELRGHIIKTVGSTAHLEVTIGGSKKVVDWTADQVLSGPFTVSMNEAVPNGQLPAPFPISASIVVNKVAGDGAVLVSLENIDVTVGQVHVARAEIR
jgi:hypothetical protein